MARLAGKVAGIQVDSTNPAELVGVRNWEINYAGDAIDVTAMDSGGAKEFIAGLTEWTVSFEAFATGAIDTDIRPGLTILVDCYQQAADNDYWYGSAIVTEVRPTVQVDGVVTYSVTAQGTGALNYGKRA